MWIRLHRVPGVDGVEPVRFSQSIAVTKKELDTVVAWDGVAASVSRASAGK